MRNVPKPNLHKFCPKCAGLGFGSVWGVCMLITGWVAMTGWGYQFVDTMASVYTGYSASFVGAIVGGIWGFFYGALIGFAFGWVYNKFLNR